MKSRLRVVGYCVALNVGAVLCFQAIMEGHCKGKYQESAGNVTAPCTICGVCVLEWQPTTNTSIAMCSNVTFYDMFVTTVERFIPYYPYYHEKYNGSICIPRLPCSHKGQDYCQFHRFPDDWKSAQVEHWSDCLCKCDDQHYGQRCSFAIPPGHTIDSFADVFHLFFVPLYFVFEYASIYIYLLNTGIALRITLETETQLLTYDVDSCRTDAPPIHEFCNEVYRDYGFENPERLCKGGGVFEKHTNNKMCAVTLNVAFSKDRVNDQNFNKFVLDDVDGKKRQDFSLIVAKIEKFIVNVYNDIPNTNGNVMESISAFVMVYKGKTIYESCPIWVTIPQYSKKSMTAPSFPPSQEISLTNIVVLENITDCMDLGEPVTDWLVWIIRTNHDEKNDPPEYRLLENPTLVLEPYSLKSGLYKVKSTVRFVKKGLNRASTYCYFEIIHVPLEPIIVGGSLRYVYYKSDIDLISDNVVDPNYPRNKQPKIDRVWHCDVITDRLCDRVKAEGLVLTKFGPFSPGKSYTFSMTVYTKSEVGSQTQPEASYQTIIISGEPIPSLLIECIRNCGGEGFKSDTREMFYFKVINSDRRSTEVNVNNDYIWTYSINGSSFTDVSDVKQEEDTPTDILIVKENALKDDQEFIFKVRGGGESPGEAQIKVRTFKYTARFHCNIFPKEGIAAETKFKIECNKVEFEEGHHLTLNIFFYDQYSKDDETGRLIGSNYMELIEDVVLTRGIVAVHATNLLGQYQTTHVKANLIYSNITAGFIDESIRNLKKLSENAGYEQKLSFISSLGDILNNNQSLKESYIEELLEVIGQESAIDSAHLELLLSAMEVVLCKGDVCTTKISDKAYKVLGEVLVDVSDRLAKELLRTAKGQSNFPFHKVNSLYKSLIKTSGAFLSVKNAELANSASKTIDYKVYELYKTGNMKVLNALDRVEEALSLKNIPYYKYCFIKTEKVYTWMKDDTPFYFTKGMKGNYSGSYATLSSNLANSLDKESRHIVVRVKVFEENPYWWSQTQDIATEVVAVTVGYSIDYRNFFLIRSFKHPIDIFLKKIGNTNATVNGVVTQPDEAEDEYKKDIAVNVHKLYTLKGEKVAVKFVDLKETDVFRVSVLKNRRPDYETLRFAAEVNYSSPWYHPTVDITVTEENDVIYVGVLPGKSVPTNETMYYKFVLQSARCQVWRDFLWDTSSCVIGDNSSVEFLHCRCVHLSSVAGFLGVPINTINPFTDYALFLNIPENPFVFALVISILLIYIMLLIWSYRKNKKDVLLTSLIVLEDNITGDEFSYLVIVFTGSRLYAGTTSQVGLILHGSESSSRSHILRSSARSTLKRNYDDWFLLYTPRHLGTISSIQLWSDHSGTSPNWFCDRIHVHDFKDNRDYSFLIGKWFGITQQNVLLESFARPFKIEKEDHLTDFVLTNVVFGFRESHMWVSVWARHPRSSLTRTQRLTIAMVTVVCVMLASIMFYDANMPEDEDVDRYSVTTREALISMYTICISITVAGLVFFAFSKSYYQSYERTEARQKKSSLRKSANRLNVDGARALQERKLVTRGFKYYFKKAIVNLRKENFQPVRVKKSGNLEIVVRKKVLILSWILSVCIIVLFSLWTVWLGLKLGRNKSLLWLTTIGITLVEDNFFVDPLKILLIAFLFGIVQTQLCDLYAYDPTIYSIRKHITKQLDRDRFIHKLRFNPFYKAVAGYGQRMTALQCQLNKVKKWWSIIDVLDIIFSTLAVFFIIQYTSRLDYFYTNSMVKSKFFNRILYNKCITPETGINNVSSFSVYLLDTVFAGLYSTEWYNGQSLTRPDESFPETGWTRTIVHRMLGAPRLRQLRVVEQRCGVTKEMKNLSLAMYCNAVFSYHTEDTDYYIAQWYNYTPEYVDVIFKKSPWIYTFPDEDGVAEQYSASTELFHSGGYIAELSRTRRQSAGTVLNLVDLCWLDMRTRVVFLELSIYNVNKNIFTSVTFATEHLASGLVLTDKIVRSLTVKRENVTHETLFVLYSILVLIKLLMTLNAIGPKFFFTWFWTLYDTFFLIVGLGFLISYRVILERFSEYLNEFQRSEKESFFPFSYILITSDLEKYMVGLLLAVTTVRSLRLFKYQPNIYYVKHRYTLHFAWPQIACVTLVLVTLTFCLQRLVAYLVNSQFPLGASHWLQHKMNFLHLLGTAVSPNISFYVYLPCALSSIGMVFYIVVLIESYNRATGVYVKKMYEKI